MQTTLKEEGVRVAGEAATRLIEFSVIGAAFVLVFLFCGLLVIYVLRAARDEIRSSRADAAAANERSMNSAEKSVRAVTQGAERSSRIIDMLESVLHLLTAQAAGGSGDVPPDSP